MPQGLTCKVVGLLPLSVCFGPKLGDSLETFFEPLRKFQFFHGRFIFFLVRLSLQDSRKCSWRSWCWQHFVTFCSAETGDHSQLRTTWSGDSQACFINATTGNVCQWTELSLKIALSRNRKDSQRLRWHEAFTTDLLIFSCIRQPTRIAAWTELWNTGVPHNKLSANYICRPHDETQVRKHKRALTKIPWPFQVQEQISRQFLASFGFLS